MVFPPLAERALVLALAAVPSLVAVGRVARRLESPPFLEPEPLASVARLTGGVLLLHLAGRGPVATLAFGYMLALVVALAHGVPRALGSPGAARVAVRVILALAVGTLFLPVRHQPAIDSNAGAVSLLDPRARAYYELAPPAHWRGRGRTFVYVALLGDREAVLATAPVLTLDGEPLPLEIGPGHVRALVPEAALLRPTLRFAFGLRAPSALVSIRFTDYYEGSTDRSPSALGLEDRPPPPGAPLEPRPTSLLGRLAGQARYFQPVVDLGAQGALAGRFAIDLWLLGAEDRVLETWY
jgi:hypothetical protein